MTYMFKWNGPFELKSKFILMSAHRDTARGWVMPPTRGFVFGANQNIIE